jgi:hypothetical protein
MELNSQVIHDIWPFFFFFTSNPKILNSMTLPVKKIIHLGKKFKCILEVVVKVARKCDGPTEIITISPNFKIQNIKPMY